MKKKKLNKDQEYWSYKVQSKPLPSWVEAFEYAYKLGLRRYLECKHCEDGILVYISANEPYNDDHYQCNICNSTYNLFEVEDESIRSKQTKTSQD